MIKPLVLALALLAALPAACFAVQASGTTSQSATQQPAAAKPANPQHVTTSYGYALYGHLKYPANFTHFDYTNPNAPKGGTIHMTGLGSYNSFNTFALRGTSAISLANFNLYYDSLMRGSADGVSEFYCLLCETISYPDDFSWVEFRLRKNARWHDGKPITAEDVIFSFDMMKNHSAPLWANPLAHVVKAVQTGPLTVRFYADAPNNRRLPLSFQIMMIIPKHYWQGRDFTAPVTKPPLSSGPYEISSFDFGRSYTLTRVKDYWAKDLPVNRGEYNYDTIINDFYRDSVASFEAFKAGYTDIRVEINPCKWQSGYTWPAVNKHQIIKSFINSQDSPLYEGFFFNMRKPEFQDPKLREGLSYAFDFTWVNKNLSCNQYLPTHSLFAPNELAAKGPPTPAELALLAPFRGKVPPQVFTTAPNEPPLTDGTQEGLRKNLRMGGQILQKAGYVIKDGKLISPRTHKPIKFEILLWDPALQRASTAWADNLKLLGVDTTITTVDYPGYTKRMENFNFDVIIGLIPFLPAPGEELRNVFSSSSANVPGSFNWAGIKDPVVDALLEKLIAAKTRPEVLTAAHALDRVVMWNFYTTPIYTGKGVYNVAYWDRFGRPAKQQNFGYAYMTSWWVDPKKDAALRTERGRTN